MTPTLADIEWTVAARFNLGPGMLTGYARRRSVAYPRFIAFQLAREAGKSFPKIGIHFHRGHTSVLSGVRRLAKLCVQHPGIAEQLADCRAALPDVVAGRQSQERGHVEALHRGAISWLARQGVV